jgi:glycosyltransferase involved in cell wall biosynthesis
MNKKSPLVSIVCTTYNHASFIRQCLDGFLMQKTNFDFEVVIHDDASTDDTKEIIEEYTLLHPDIFVPMYQTENQYSKGVRGISIRFNLPRCRGKYIALCEGDDYWTDTLKLQKQFDLIERYPNASMCVALNKQIYVQAGTEKIDLPYIGKHFPLIYFNDATQYFHTSTYVIRKSMLEYLTLKYLPLFQGDTALRYLLINEGPFVVLNEVVSAYRITGLGIWSSLKRSKQLLDNHKVYKLFRKHHKSKRIIYYWYKETAYWALGMLFRIRERIKK